MQTKIDIKADTCRKMKMTLLSIINDIQTQFNALLGNVEMLLFIRLDGKFIHQIQIRTNTHTNESSANHCVLFTRPFEYSTSAQVLLSRLTI